MKRLILIIFTVIVLFGCSKPGTEEPKSPLRRPASSADRPTEIEPSKTLSFFEHIAKEDIDIPHLFALIGTPDADVGSGIHIYVYNLSDGSKIRVGTSDNQKVMYIDHISIDGIKRRLK